MNPQEWNRLVAGWMDGTLGDEDQQRLREACQADPAKEEELAKASLADRLLPLALAPEMDDTAIRRILELSARPAEAAAGGVVPLRKGNHANRSWGKWAAISAAAAVVVCAGVWSMSLMRPSAAYLSRSESLEWKSGAQAGEGRLHKGQRLAAASGLAEIEMGNGTRVVLEAPFEVEIRGPESLEIHTGRLVLRSPASAGGFNIRTPRGMVSDCGPELAMYVGRNGVVETHVLEGAAKFSGDQLTRNISLFAGEAVRIESDNRILRMQADSGAFVANLPLPEDLPGGYVHWDMDEGQGDRAADNGHDLAGGEDSSLVLGKDDIGNPKVALPQWTQGVRGGGLAFDGLGSFAESTYRGIEGVLPRTVALWVKLPVDGDRHAGTGILSWGTVMQDSAWQISVNWSDVDGPVGRLRLGTYDGRIVGTTDLRDAQWHHIAVVMYPPSHPGAAVNVLLYVDGKLEPISVRSNFRVNTNTRLAEHGVSLGRHVSLINKTRKYFRGEMDDVFILGRPLNQEQVRRLMKGDAGYMPQQ